MFRIAYRTWVAAMTLTAASASFAQAAPAAKADTPARAAELGYRSTFDNYQTFTDEKVGSWKDANDSVGRIGGWREYAKEARQPDKAAASNGNAPATAPARADDADPHAGHGQKR